MPSYLTTASQVMCPHGGHVTLTSINTTVKAWGAPVLLESDQHVVAGCAFTIGPKPSPCVRVQWSVGSTKTAAGAKPLTEASVGTCYGPEGAPQGLAIVISTQPTVRAL
jgi:hypothetical protein